MAAPLKAIANCCKTGRIQFHPRCLLVRHGHSFDPKSKRPKPMERRIFEEVTQPIYPKPWRHPAEVCGRKKEAEEKLVVEENEYEKFLISQMRKLFEESQMIIVCQPLPMSGVRMRRIRVALQKEGLKLSICNNKFALEIIKDTKLESMTPYFKGINLLITSPDPKPKELIQLTRKMPELIVMGGFLQDRLVSKYEMQEIVQLPPIEQLYGEFAGCLSLMGGGKTLSLLNSHQTNLSVNLGQYVKQKQEGEDT